MRIGILNLPFDNNYGGNLQRYALIRVLRDMGHDVKHINLRFSYRLPYYKIPYCYAKRLLMKIAGSSFPIFYEKKKQKENERLEVNALKFYECYVEHTRTVYAIRQVRQVCQECKFDAIVVGSDQVWRHSMVKRGLGLNNYMLEFIHNDPIRKIAYAVSFGTEDRLKKSQVRRYLKLYKKFNAVSVRESQSVDFLNEYGWIKPQARHVLDPIFLLKKEDYLALVEKMPVDNMAKDKIFCYILDINTDVENIIQRKKEELGSSSVIISLKDTAKVSIEQWLYNIYMCRLMITDSFHGVAFSILFNKPFLFCGNERRGNMRINSLYKMFMIDSSRTEYLDWQTINRKINQFRLTSKEFLNDSLE